MIKQFAFAALLSASYAAASVIYTIPDFMQLTTPDFLNTTQGTYRFTAGQLDWLTFQGTANTSFGFIMFSPLMDGGTYVYARYNDLLGPGATLIEGWFPALTVYGTYQSQSGAKISMIVSESPVSNAPEPAGIAVFGLALLALGHQLREREK